MFSLLALALGSSFAFQDFKCRAHESSFSSDPGSIQVESTRTLEVVKKPEGYSVLIKTEDRSFDLMDDGSPRDQSQSQKVLMSEADCRVSVLAVLCQASAQKGGELEAFAISFVPTVQGSADPEANAVPPQGGWVTSGVGPKSLEGLASQSFDLYDCQ